MFVVLKPTEMNRLVVFLILISSALCSIKADYVKDVVVPVATNSNFAFYPVYTGVFLRLDTRDGKVDAIVPTKPAKNRALTSALVSSPGSAGRFELYPTDNMWEWVLTDKTTGEMWLLRWDSKKEDILKKVTTD